MDAIVVGMTAGTGDGGTNALRHHLDALACLMMLERVNYLMSIGVPLPRTETADQLAAIIYAAFHLDG